ncbi:MAG: cobalamin-dependent protein [Candidatus Lokiarchaeota archaeon]|nr:cobalamin-dependent protein [Candidatus Lokiarchaeota archaeon]
MGFIDELVDLNEDVVHELLKKRLDSDEDPLAILTDVKTAMKIIGDKFSEREYFLPELIMSGEILKEIFELLQPKLKEGAATESKGKIILGTVAGDIHDIGKDIVRFMLDINGYEVIDLGVDVPAEKFIKAIIEHSPKILALSGFLTLSFDSMKEIIEKLQAEGFRDSLKIMIGGGTIDERIVEYVGADKFGDSAVTAVKIANEWMSE